MVSDKEYQEYRKKLLRSMDSQGQPTQEYIPNQAQNTQKQTYFQESGNQYNQKTETPVYSETQKQQPQQYPSSDYWTQPTANAKVAPKPVVQPVAQAVTAPAQQLPSTGAQQAPQAVPASKPVKNNKRLIILLGILGGVIGAFFIVNYILIQVLGINLLEVAGIVAESSSTLENSPSFNQLSPEVIGIDLYNSLSANKASTEASFNIAKNYGLGNINDNTELVNNLKNSLGNTYSVYMFSIYTGYSTPFKVFEWSVELNNGLITKFNAGMLNQNNDAIIQVDESISLELFTGKLTSAQVIQYINEKKIKINPIIESGKISGLIPDIINALPQQ